MMAEAGGFARALSALVFFENTATHYNVLRHAAMQCNELQQLAPHYNALQHVMAKERQICVCFVRTCSTHCNTLQHAATNCNI